MWLPASATDQTSAGRETESVRLHAGLGRFRLTERLPSACRRRERECFSRCDSRDFSLICQKSFFSLPGQQRLQQLRQPVIAQSHAVLDLCGQDRVSGGLRFVTNGLRERGDTTLFVECNGPHSVTRIPGLVEFFSSDDLRGLNKLQTLAAHAHLESFRAAPDVSEGVAGLQSCFADG